MPALRRQERRARSQVPSGSVEVSQHRIRCPRINVKTGKQCTYVAVADTATGAEDKLNTHVRRVHGG
jgi:hypothetical protein